MKKQTSIILILFLSLFCSPSWGETMDDLVYRDGLYYKKFTDIPFTGETTGKGEGSFKDGKRVGKWVFYFDNGQLMMKGEYKDGKRVGKWINYFDNGQLRQKSEYKDGKAVGEWIHYWDNGQLWYKGVYKDGKKVGKWVYYKYHGTIDEKITY